MLKKTTPEETKKTSKNFSAALPPHTLEVLKVIAEEEHRSVNGQLVYIVEKYLKEAGRL
jgi:hypothetical protein